MDVIILIVVGVLFASFGQLFFKLGANIAGPINTTNLLSFINLYVIIGLVLYGLGSVFWIFALSKADLSFVYPFISLTFLIVYGLSIFILKEPFHLNRLLGTGIIIMGLSLLFAFER